MMSDLRLKVNGGGYGIVVHVDEKQKAKIIDMGKAYSEWKLNQDKEPVSEIEKKYQELLETLSPEQEEVITEYCNAIFSSGADIEEFFYRL